MGRGVQDLYNKWIVSDQDLVAIVDADEWLDERAWRLLEVKESQRPGKVWRVSLEWALYDSCWIHNRMTQVSAMSTVRTLKRLKWDAQRIRATHDAYSLDNKTVGLHCSWCFGKPGSEAARHRFRQKLISMTDGDATDYAAYEQQKWDNARIDSLMRGGLWLDGYKHGRNVCT